MFRKFNMRFIPLLFITFFAISCAKVAPPQELAAVPAAPSYLPTETPLVTDIPAPTRRPTPRPTLRVVERAAPTSMPTRIALNIPAIPTANSPTVTSLIQRKPVHDLAALNEYQRGIAYVATQRDQYRALQSEQSLDELFASGANYISVLVTWYQTDIHSTQILRANNTPSDDDLMYVINYAHAHGLKVLLKPQVDLSNDDPHWRGQIAFDNEEDWQTWFASYRQFILRYARFAQNNGVEEFAVGTELYATTSREADWRAMIRAVRQQYTGLLTYSANHSGEETAVNFWDALDFIGVNVFYHITNYRTPTMDQIMTGWEAPVRTLSELHTRFPRQPVIFTEVGYPSMDLASVWPWNWERNGAVDLDEQAMLYQGLFLTWWHNPYLPWFRGMFIWNWLPDPNQGGPDNNDYTPHNKPAEQILDAYYQTEAQNSAVAK